MEFQAQPGDGFHFRQIPTLLADLLREIPNWKNACSENSEDRFYPPPTNDPEEKELIQDWKAYIQPGMAEHFQSCREIVASDLAKMVPEKEDKNEDKNEDKVGSEKEENLVFGLTIPLEHVDAWINSLTQARLAIAIKLDLTEEELLEKEQATLANNRDFAIFQVNFYGFLTHYFVEHLME